MALLLSAMVAAVHRPSLSKTLHAPDMTALKKILESTTKVRFHDCDPYNHLNNSRYIDYIVTARGDQLLDNYGFDMYALARKERVGWVSAQTQISYLSPALLAEEVTIQTQLLAYSEKSLLVEGLMWNSEKTILKAVMWAKLVHFNLRTQTSHQHAEELIELFEQVVNPLTQEVGFEERAKGLRSSP
jgi:YbgC/YbaW family acyl-CoA thioester hydrolase